MTSCNGADPLDSTSKHDYTDGQLPYLRTNVSALVEISLEFPKARISEPQVILLKDYAEKFHTNMHMTVDEVLDGLSGEKTVFYPINANRGVWNRDSAPAVNGQGWYWGVTGTLAEQGDAVFSVELDRTNRLLIVSAVNNPDTGAGADANVGFAVNNGHDLDDYVRFKVSSVVIDPSKVVTRVSIPAGDYAAASILFEDYADAIETNLGISIRDFLARYDASGTPGEEEIEIYLSDAQGRWYAADADGNRGWVAPEDAYQRPPTTSGWMGWWLNTELNITNWGEDGCLVFIEGGDKCVNIGRYPNVASGTQCNLRFLYTLASDHSRFIEFILSVTFE
jgi:hypothetical protein